MAKRIAKQTSPGASGALQVGSPAWGGKKAMRAPWWTMELREVDLIVSGHNHAYERFAQQDHTGLRSTKGIRSVIAGTGGNRHIASAPRWPPTAWSAFPTSTGCCG